MSQSKNRLTFVLLTFLIVIYTVYVYKPLFIFTPSGTFREFGLGYTKKTVIPMWLCTFLIAIVSYLFVRFVYLFMNI